MPQLIIADAGPLIGLAKIGQLELLRHLYQSVLIPPVVHSELKPESGYQGSDALKAALDHGWLKVSDKPSYDLLISLKAVLDAGEAEAIALALQTKNSSLIIDERRGRAVALHRNVKIMGTGAVLLAAKQLNHIENIREPLQSLVSVGYRLSPQLQARLLTMAGEIDQLD